MTNAYIVTGRKTGNLYVRADTPQQACDKATALLGEIDAWHAGPLRARQISDPEPDGTTTFRRLNPGSSR